MQAGCRLVRRSIPGQRERRLVEVGTGAGNAEKFRTSWHQGWLGLVGSIVKSMKSRLDSHVYISAVNIRHHEARDKTEKAPEDTIPPMGSTPVCLAAASGSDSVCSIEVAVTPRSRLSETSCRLCCIMSRSRRLFQRPRRPRGWRRRWVRRFHIVNTLSTSRNVSRTARFDPTPMCMLTLQIITLGKKANDPARRAAMAFLMVSRGYHYHLVKLPLGSC